MLDVSLVLRGQLMKLVSVLVKLTTASEALRRTVLDVNGRMCDLEHGRSLLSADCALKGFNFDAMAGHCRVMFSLRGSKVCRGFLCVGSL